MSSNEKTKDEFEINNNLSKEWKKYDIEELESDFSVVSSDSRSTIGTRPKIVKPHKNWSYEPKRKRRKKNRELPEQNMFKFVGYVEPVKAKPIYAVEFNYFIKDRDIFATACGNQVMIYECLNQNNDSFNKDEDSSIKILKSYAIPNKDEYIYTLAWSYDDESPIIAFGGLQSIVRVLYLNSSREKTFIGHTGSINEMKFHPIKPYLLVTASKDYSLKLWHVKNEICIAVFSGVAGHRSEVISVDFNFHGDYFVSGGMDHCIKLWKLNSDHMKDVIEHSEDSNIQPGSFPTLRIQYPDFTTRKIHANYVDSIKCFGNNTFLSKSCQDTVVWWKIGDFNDQNLDFSKQVRILHTFDISSCQLWYMKMTMDIKQQYLCVGNEIGQIMIFNLNSDKPPKNPIILSNSKINKAMRQITFSKDGKTIIGVSDGGKIIRWDKIEPDCIKQESSNSYNV